MSAHSAHVFSCRDWTRANPDADRLLYVVHPTEFTSRYVWRDCVCLSLVTSMAHLAELQRNSASAPAYRS